MPDNPNESETSSEQNSGDHGTHKPSRRMFIKTTSALILNALVASIPVPVPGIIGQPIQSIPQPQLDRILKLLPDHRLMLQLLEIARNNGFPFEFTSQTLQLATESDGTLGCVFRASKTPNYRTGANLVITVDPTKLEVLGVQLITAWSLNDQFVYQILNADSRDEPYYQRSFPNEKEHTEPRLLVPILEQYGFAPRLDVAPLAPGELVETGWPDEKFRGFKYLGISIVDWLKTDGALRFRTSELLEQFPDSDELHRITVEYPKNI